MFATQISPPLLVNPLNWTTSVSQWGDKFSAAFNVTYLWSTETCEPYHISYNISVENAWLILTVFSVCYSTWITCVRACPMCLHVKYDDLQDWYLWRWNPQQSYNWCSNSTHRHDLLSAMAKQWLWVQLCFPSFDSTPLIWDTDPSSATTISSQYIMPDILIQMNFTALNISAGRMSDMARNSVQIMIGFHNDTSKVVQTTQSMTLVPGMNILGCISYELRQTLKSSFAPDLGLSNVIIYQGTISDSLLTYLVPDLRYFCRFKNALRYSRSPGFRGFVLDQAGARYIYF